MSHFEVGKHGNATSANAYEYGYDMAVLVSEDNFTTYTIIEDSYTMDPTINPSLTQEKLGAGFFVSRRILGQGDRLLSGFSFTTVGTKQASLAV